MILEVKVVGLTIENWMEMSAVDWDMKKGPLTPMTLTSQEGQSIGVEIHKKNDKKDGDVIMVFKVTNPKEPLRSKHKRDPSNNYLQNRCPL